MLVATGPIGVLAAAASGWSHAGEHRGSSAALSAAIIADHGERAVAIAELIAPIEPRAVGVDGAHARPLRRQIHPAGNVVSAPLKLISPAKLARPLAPAIMVMIAIRPLPSMRGEGFVEARLGVEARRGDRQPARRAYEAVERHRPVDLRPARDDRDRDIGEKVGRGAAARRPARGLTTAA